MLEFTLLHPRATQDHLGYIPDLLSLDDPDNAAAQLNRNYSYGGGWRPLERFEYNAKDHSIKYPGDPRLYPIATAKLREETLYFYQYAQLAIIQPDGSFEVARVD